MIKTLECVCGYTMGIQELEETPSSEDRMMSCLLHAFRGHWRKCLVHKESFHSK